MKLAGLGVITAALGLTQSIDGLLIAGGSWVLIGLLAKLLKDRLAPEPSRGTAPAVDTEAGDSTPADRTTMLFGTLIFGLLATSSLAIGLLEIGFEPEDSDWRWLPVAVGGIAAFLAVVPAAMYGLGSGMIAAVEAVEGDPTVPATVTIEAVRETGMLINDRPRLEFDLVVEPEGMESYRVSKKATVPHIAIGAIGIGDGFHALIDPERPDGIQIDWERPIPAGSGADPAERLAQLQSLRESGAISDDEYAEQRRRILDSI